MILRHVLRLSWSLAYNSIAGILRNVSTPCYSKTAIRACCAMLVHEKVHDALCLGAVCLKSSYKLPSSVHKEQDLSPKRCVLMISLPSCGIAMVYTSILYPVVMALTSPALQIYKR